jgi:hypothetical protein
MTAASVPAGMDWVQWLALTGGLVAVLTFVTGRFDSARSDAAAVYVMTTLRVSIEPGSSEKYEATYEVHNDGPLPVLWVFPYLFEGIPYPTESVAAA